MSAQRISLLVYYIQTGWKDTRRAYWILLVNSIIVVGICLPLIVLSGLKRGLVSQFQADLLKSPTARRITASAFSMENAFNLDKMRQLKSQIPGLSLVIPSIYRLVNISANGKNADVTLQSTVPGDPYLNFYGLDILVEDELGIIISNQAAHELGVKYRAVNEKKIEIEGAQFVTLELARQSEPGKSYLVNLAVRGIFPSASTGEINGFVNFNVADKIEDFIKGRSVPAWNLPSAVGNPPARYLSYIAFSFNEYSVNDIQKLHLFGYKAEKIAVGDPDGAVSERLLGGLLHPHDLNVYRLTPGNITDKSSNITVAHQPDMLMEITEEDDVIFPWVPPVQLEINRIPHRVVGLSGSPFWLKRYLRNDQLLFRLPGSDTPSGSMDVILPLGVPSAPSANCIINLGKTGPSGSFNLILPKTSKADDLRAVGILLDSMGAIHHGGLPLHALALIGSFSYLASKPSLLGSPPLAVVSSELASNIACLPLKLLEYDTIGNRFVFPATTNLFMSAEIYTDDVLLLPEVDESLVNMRYGTMSSRTRVQEIKSYSTTLSNLVNVVAIAVVLFGSLTMIFVFWDLTRSKCGAIGVMSAMGIPFYGIMVMMLVRSLAVGVCGFSFSYLLSQLVSFILANFFDISCLLYAIDYVFILSLSICVCVFGVLVPSIYFSAWKDPVEALISSKNN